MTDGPREEVNTTLQFLPDWGWVTAEPLCAGHMCRRPVGGLPHTPPATLTVPVGSEQARFPGAPGCGDSATVVVGGFPENWQTGDPALEATGPHGGPGRLIVSGFSGLDTAPSDGVSDLRKQDSQD